MAQARKDIAHHFQGRVPVIKTARNLTLEHAQSIQACLDTGYPGSQIDDYLGKTRGTVRRWVRDLVLTRIIFKEQVELNQKIEKCEDLGQRLSLLRYIDDVNLTPENTGHVFKPLIHQNFNEPEWIQALLDRDANINLEYEIQQYHGVYGHPYVILKPIWTVRNLKKLEMFCKNGASLDGVSPRLGYSIMEQFVYEYIEAGLVSDPERQKRRLDGIRILFEHGADIQPLYDSLYKALTLISPMDVIDVIMTLGFNVELEKTLVYRAMNFQLSREELINCFYLGPPGKSRDRQSLLRRYPTYDAMQERVLDIYSGTSDVPGIILDRMKNAITNNIEKSVILKTTIEDTLPLSHDVVHLISTYVYTYTPY